MNRKDMSKYEKISEARKVLQLPERATLKEVKTNYRRLLKRWHPDTCQESKRKCKEMTEVIVSAYETVMDYCRHYRFSFFEKDVRDNLSAQDWWHERFGSDPLWGKGAND